MSSRRVVMISGANRGIGAAIAREMASAGWALSLGVRDVEGFDRTATPEALVCRFDAREPRSEAEWVAATAGRFGRIDALVNNAGIIIPKSVIEASDEDIDLIMEVNFKSPLRLSRAVWPYLKVSGEGRFIAIASLSGKRVKSPGAGLYSTSKFAVVALAHALRHTGFEYGIRSTAICPGFVATDMAASVNQTDQSRLTPPSEVAKIVRLAIEAPNTCSISEIPINCGLEEMY